MKPEQAPIEIAKELHELNKKLDRLITLLPTLKGKIVVQPTPYPITPITPIDPYNPVVYTTKTNNPVEQTISLSNKHEPQCVVAGTLDGEPDHFITGNPEAHDYGTEYINVLKEWITPDAEQK